MKSLTIGCLAAALVFLILDRSGGEVTIGPVAPPPAFSSDQDIAASNVTAKAHGGLWIHPGVRNLDPKVFGTVASPLGEEFMFGVALYDRLDDGNGNWTTTASMGPASNQTTAINGTAWCRVVDRTPSDLPAFTDTTYDEVDFNSEFVDPFGRRIEIVAKRALPKGPFHEFFGGVGTNVIMHGRTGLGGKKVPQCFAYLTFWARGSIKIDGVLLPGNDDRLVHGMVTWGVRDASNAPGPAGGNGPYLGTDAEVDREDLEFHVLLPDVRFNPTPQPNFPVVGMGQSFVHLVFEDVRLEGSLISGVLHR